MKAKKVLLFFVLTAFLLAFYSQARVRVNEYRSDVTHNLHAAAVPVSPLILKALAGEFKGIIADYLLLEAASFIGSKDTGTATDKDWAAVALLLEQSSTLDPYFKQTYILAQGSLPWFSQKYDQTLAILERSKAHLPWDWRPGFFIGFDHYFFLNDNLSASQELMEASRIPDAPIALATLASKLSMKAGQTGAGIDFLRAMYEKTEDTETKVLLETRIQALKGVQAIEAAAAEFKVKFCRMPHTLDELVETAIIPTLPPNPYNRPYSIHDGIVDF